MHTEKAKITLLSEKIRYCPDCNLDLPPQIPQSHIHHQTYPGAPKLQTFKRTMYVVHPPTIPTPICFLNPLPSCPFSRW